METAKEEILRSQLAQLNKKVADAIEERTEFLDKNMAQFAEFQIGEKVYNCKSGQYGVVTEHYRYYTKQNVMYDDSFRCDCIIQEPIGGNSYDNTSRYAGFHPWVKAEDYENKTQNYIRTVEQFAMHSR